MSSLWEKYDLEDYRTFPINPGGEKTQVQKTRKKGDRARKLWQTQKITSDGGCWSGGVWRVNDAYSIFSSVLYTFFNILYWVTDKTVHICHCIGLRMRYFVYTLCFWTIQRHHCPLVHEPRKFWYLQLSRSSSFSPVHHALERLSLSSLLPTCFFHKENGDFILLCSSSGHNEVTETRCQAMRKAFVAHSHSWSNHKLPALVTTFIYLTSYSV